MMGVPCPMVMYASHWSCTLRRMESQNVVIGLANPRVCRRMHELRLIAKERTTVQERPRGKGTQAPDMQGYDDERFGCKLFFSCPYFRFSAKQVKSMGVSSDLTPTRVSPKEEL